MKKRRVPTGQECKCIKCETKYLKEEYGSPLFCKKCGDYYFVCERCEQIFEEELRQIDESERELCMDCYSLQETKCLKCDQYIRQIDAEYGRGSAPYCKTCWGTLSSYEQG